MIRQFFSACCGCLILTNIAHSALIAEVRTSEGNFSIELDWIRARRTVSHFIRLATGQQPWLDEKTGRIRAGAPFYDGLKFYKKVGSGASIPKYIQAGARYPGDPFVFTTDENQGAGYILRDEMTTGLAGSLNVPHGQWTVTMANTGPHSSSSQFLINLVNDTSWNAKNSAFGKVQQLFIEYDINGTALAVTYNGWQVVTAIHAANSVTINSIRFRITSNSPPTFNSADTAGELPWMITPQITSVTHTPTEVHLGYAPMAATKIRMYVSTDLFNWSYFPSGNTYLLGGAFTNPPIISLHGNVPRAFYRLTAATYPLHSLPANFQGKTIRMYAGNWYINGGSTPPYISLRFGQFGITNEYLLAGSSNWEPLDYNFIPRGPFSGDIVVTSAALAGQTFRLFFGGAQQLEDANPDLIIPHTRKPAIDILTGQADVEIYYTVTSP